MGIIYSFMGYRASKSIHTVSDYFLAGRKIGTIPLAIALIATQLGGGVILGTSYESYISGFAGMLYVIGISLGFIILGLGLAGRLRSFNISTTAELFEVYYKSVLLKKIASVLSITSLCGILLAQVIASFNLMISLGIYSDLLFFLFWVLVIGYTMVGGLKAIVNNDIFQLSFIIAVFCGLFAYELIFAQAGQVLANAFTLFKTSKLPFSTGGTVATILMPACYLLIEQDIAQNIFAARTPKTAIVATLLASIFMLCFAIIPVYFGIKAFSLGLPLQEGANPLLVLIDNSYPQWVTTLVVYGILAAIISTADALLCAISSHIAQDFTFFSTEQSSLKYSKFIMLAIGLTTLILGRYFNNIIHVIIGSYAIPVTALIVPLLVAYYKIPSSKTGALTSILCGLGGFIYAKVAGTAFPPELGGVAASAAGYIIGYLVEKNESPVQKS